jgi:4-amino-4-deoxy-L-arabinose transferase-like glycosyltransferase
MSTVPAPGVAHQNDLRGTGNTALLASAQRHGLTTAVVLGCALLVYLALAVAASLTKRPWSDEAWFTSPSLNLAATGHMGTTIIETAGTKLLRINEHTYWAMPLYMVLEAGWIKLAGASLFSARLASILWGVLALVSWFALVKKLAGEDWPALLAVALLSVDYLFIDMASLARMDMMSVALGAAGLAVYVALRERHLNWAVLLSQSLVASSGMTHPNALLYLVSLLFLTFYFDRRRLSVRHLAIALAPYLIAGGAWGWYILQDVPAFRAQFFANAADGGRFSGFAHPLAALSQEWTDRYSHAFGLGPHSPGHSGPIYLKSLVLLAYVTAIGCLVSFKSLRSQESSRLLLALGSIFFVLQCLFNQKLTTYLVHIVPVYDAILAMAVYGLWRQKRAWRPFLAAVVMAVCLVQLGATAYRVKLNEQRPYRRMIAVVKQRRQPGRLVFGTAAFAFDLGFNGELLDDPRLGYYSRRRADLIVVDSIYLDDFEGQRRQLPSIYRYVQETLKAQYKRVYDQDGYQVFARAED